MLEPRLWNSRSWSEALAVFGKCRSEPAGKGQRCSGSNSSCDGERAGSDWNNMISRYGTYLHDDNGTLCGPWCGAWSLDYPAVRGDPSIDRPPSTPLLPLVGEEQQQGDRGGVP